MSAPVASLDHWCGIIVDGIGCFSVRFHKVCNGSMFIGWSNSWYVLRYIFLIIVIFSSCIILSTLSFSGSGKGLTTNTAIIVLTHHFKENRLGLAIGVSFVIMGISGIIAPQFVMVLLRHFSSKVIELTYLLF